MKAYPWIAKLLFRLEAERAHNLTLKSLALAGALPPIGSIMRRSYSMPDAKLKVKVFGLEFPNPVGLAAGYDKQGSAMFGLACLGFGHLELGTVTPLSQVGNPRPRIFRLPEDQALINRMGFPNQGADALMRFLQRGRPRDVILGINIGKGANTPLEMAAEDYVFLLRVFYEFADYVVVNVSSPNTIGLRRLQARDHLEGLLKRLVRARQDFEEVSQRKVPLLVKLSPDLNDYELDDSIGAIQDFNLEGVIVTNTTIARDGLLSRRRAETGGVSGAPVRKRSTHCIRHIYEQTNGLLPIIGVGGIMKAQDALEKLDAGASLVQLYTGLVYRGPGLVREILEALKESKE